jgi:hypothetical protein
MKENAMESRRSMTTPKQDDPHTEVLDEATKRQIEQSMELVRGLRAAASLVERTSYLEWPSYEGAVSLFIHCYGADDAIAQRAMQDARRAIGGLFQKRVDDWSFSLDKPLSKQVHIVVTASRSKVCEAKVVGTKIEKVKEIPAEKLDEAKLLREQLAALEVEREQEVEIIEWDCPDALGEKAHDRTGGEA